MIITTDHSGFDYQEMADHAKLIFDTRNATAGCHGGNIVVLGQPVRHEAKRVYEQQEPVEGSGQKEEVKVAVEGAVIRREAAIDPDEDQGDAHGKS
ncbi:hypothetical protein Q0F98_26075 [Paenibacillus amylolyticus]|nr:hypothetical protein Q0F98_26075 [Paenibacillus amylolyticus]